MFDFNLQLRIWRSATDAAMQWGQASMAATAAWQDQARDHSTGQRPRPQASIADPFSMLSTNPMTLPFAWWQSVLPQFGLPTPPLWPGTGFEASRAPATLFGDPWGLQRWMDAFTPNSTASPGWGAQGWSAPGWGAMDAAAWPSMMQAFWAWPSSPWALYQTPLTAMMMSAGMPYTVALPTARASTATLDAADATRQQVLNVFSAYRSDGGHGSAHSFRG